MVDTVPHPMSKYFSMYKPVCGFRDGLRGVVAAVVATLPIALVTLGVLPSTAPAAWIENGVPVCANPECGADNPRICSDGAGGAFIIWNGSLRTDPDTDIYMQHLLATGDLDPSWPAIGVLVCDVPGLQTAQRVIADGFGGAIAVWQDGRSDVWDVYAQRITANGTVAPGWPTDGFPVVVAPNNQSAVFLVSDGAGGAFICWNDERDHYGIDDIYAQHLTAAGEIAAGWMPNGNVIAYGPADLSTSPLADGVGGFFVFWSDGRGADFDIYGIHLQGDGMPAPGWTANGNPIVAAPRVQGAFGVVRDGTGGFYLGWVDGSLDPATGYIDVFTLDLYAKRIGFDGTTAPGWPAAGVPVCRAPSIQENAYLAGDATGAFLFWSDYRTFNGADVYASRLTPDGQRAPGWPVDGLYVAGPEAFQISRGITADGLGGAFLLYEATGAPQHVWVQHLTGSAQFAPGWQMYGTRVTSTTGYEDVSRMIGDGQGGAIAVWTDSRLGGTGIYAQKFVPDGVVAVAVALVASEATPEAVRLTWELGEGTVPEVAIYRRTEREPWRWLATEPLDGSHRVSYEDTAITAGTRYAYRIGWAEEGIERYSQESWIEVPAAFELALAGLTPNPSRGPLTVAFSLPDDRPAMLELLDVTGRRMVRRDLAGLSAGRHFMRLDEGVQIAPGVYFVRLTHAGRVLKARGAVVR